MTQADQNNPIPSPLEARVTELEKALEEANFKLSESENQKLRALADLQNQKRREAEQKALWGEMSVGAFLRPMINCLGELRQGMEHTSDEAVKQTIDKFLQSLLKAGLEKIEPQEGDPLDTNFHEVMMVAPGKAGRVVQTLEVGWKYGSTVLCPAKVSAATV